MLKLNFFFLTEEKSLRDFHLFWDVTQHRLVFSYNVSGKPISAIFKGQPWTLRMTPIVCPDMSVTLSNTSEERRPHLHGGESLKSRKKPLGLASDC